MAYGITVDGIFYSVHVVYDTIQRSFDIIEGFNSGRMLTGRQTRDVLGTGYSYALNIEPDPANREDYDALYEVLSAPQASHMITLPYGQSSITFEAMVESGTDTFQGRIGGKNNWHGLSVKFTYIEPYRV